MSLLVAGALIISLIAVSAPGAVHPKEDPFEKGNLLCEQGKHEECIHYLEIALHRYPEGSNILWNLGLASAAAGQHEKALTYWQRYRKLRSEDWRAIPKLIQTYQALGRLKERDGWLDKLFNIRKATQDEELQETLYFCREQFRLNGKLIMAFQYFEPAGERMKFYFFSAVGNDGKEQFYISLGSYKFTNQYSHEAGLLGEDERVYHLDGYYKDGMHKTFGFLHRKKTPSYDTIRPTIQKILEGKIKPLSSSQFK